VEIYVANDRQAQLQAEATHFNPVKLVCSLGVYKKLDVQLIFFLNYIIFCGLFCA